MVLGPRNRTDVWLLSNRPLVRLDEAGTQVSTPYADCDLAVVDIKSVAVDVDVNPSTLIVTSSLSRGRPTPSTSSAVRQGPRGLISSVLNSPVIVSAMTLS